MINKLIAASSIGAGLANIRENGIEAELADIAAEPAPAPKKRKAKATSPTQRTLAELRKRGITAQVVERFNRFPPPGRRVDLFGVIDLVAIVPPVTGVVAGAIAGIQACAGTSHAARRDKILAEPRARQWVEAGGRLELWSWSKRGGAGKRKLWALRVETYAEMVASAGSPT